ncbi:unnamed protein product [Pylaiella littoralis]
MRVAAATAAAGGGGGTMNKTSTSQSRESAALVDFLQQGTKRRRSAAQNIPLEKGKRRELLAQPRGADSGLATNSEIKGASASAKRNPRRSTRLAKDREAPAEKRVSFASSSSGSSAGSALDSGVAKEELLLRFPGFEANDAGKECISCYQVANIMVNFVCEGRREEAKRAQAAEEGLHQSGQDCSGAARVGSVTWVGGLGVDVPHVMCVDCFRVFVESRVSDRKLVTSHDFDGYTVGCPMGCADSFVDPSCFEEIMGAEFMVKYRRFAAIHLASHMRVVWCPGCHCGVLPEAAAAGRRSSVVPAPAVRRQPPPRPSGSGYLWALWGRTGGTASASGAVEDREAGAGAEEGRAPSQCIGCPGCQASLCMACKALHASGVDCAAAAAAAAAATAAAAGRRTDGAGQVGAAEGGGNGGASGAGGGSGSEATRRVSTGSQGGEGGGLGEEPATTNTKRCPNCHVPIFKDGGCNHMKCSMCQHEFCWLHLTEWVVGGDCQRGHWSNNPALNRAYNAQRVAHEATQQNCTAS